MKFKLVTNILRITSLGIIFSGSANATSITKITGFNLKTCVSQVCLELQADEVKSGQITLLQTLKNYKASFKENGQTQELTGDFGYIDFEKNTVVLKNKSRGEILINLNTLKKEEFQ